MHWQRWKPRAIIVAVLGACFLALAAPTPAQAENGGNGRTQNILFNNRPLAQWEFTFAAGLAFAYLNAALIGRDTFNNPAEVDRRNLALSRTATALAFYLTFYPYGLGGYTPLPFGLQPFVRLGLMTFLASEITAGFNGLNTTPQGTGTVSLKRSWALPFFIGAALAATQLGIDCQDLWLEFYVGGLLTFWTATLNVAEFNQPLAIALSQSWTTFDPSFGFAVKYYLANLGTIGAMLYWTYLGSGSLYANSPNYATQSYEVSFRRRLAAILLFTYSIALDSYFRRQEL